MKQFFALRTTVDKFSLCEFRLLWDTGGCTCFHPPMSLLWAENRKAGRPAPVAPITHQEPRSAFHTPGTPVVEPGARQHSARPPSAICWVGVEGRTTTPTDSPRVLIRSWSNQIHLFKVRQQDRAGLWLAGPWRIIEATALSRLPSYIFGQGPARTQHGNTKDSNLSTMASIR